MKKFIEKIKGKATRKMGEETAHLTYLAFAFLEGHGVHSWAAGALAAFIILSPVLGGEE